MPNVWENNFRRSVQKLTKVSKIEWNTFYWASNVTEMLFTSAGVGCVQGWKGATSAFQDIAGRGNHGNRCQINWKLFG